MRPLVVALVAALTLLAAPAAHAAGSSTISGSVFQDTNRNGVQDAGEPAMGGKMIYLLDGSGANQIAYTTSDSAGRYAFLNLADGDYRVSYSDTDWHAIWQTWVPTTTGSVMPRVQVHLSGSATANFGWRQITRSTTYASPVSTYTGPNGMKVNSYNDAVPAQAIYDDLMQGGLIGPEAQTVTVAFDWGAQGDNASMSISGTPGYYSDFRATLAVSWTRWLTDADDTLFHEYGHAWSMYYAYLMQQSDQLDSYLKARGIAGDSRLDSSHAWSRYEMIAEDYRELFGSAGAAAYPQENADIPPAAQVPGLRDFLATTYMQATGSAPAPAPTPSPSPSPTPTPTTALTVSGLAMNPSAVRTSGTASFTLSAPAKVTLTILDARGAVVRTLLGSVSEPAGTSSAAWDRKTASGAKAKSGTYTLSLDAVDASGKHVTATSSFTAS